MYVEILLKTDTHKETVVHEDVMTVFFDAGFYCIQEADRIIRYNASRILETREYFDSSKEVGRE